MAVSIGELLEGKYRVVRLIGTGGMGSVYEGENVLISRRVAIKVLHPGLGQKRSIVARFEQEARAAGKIQNDHINEVIDIGTLEDGSKFIVLEFLEGETLRQRLKRAGALTPMQAAQIVMQVLRGLASAHRAGIVHRDLKPGNIFILWEKLGQRDFVKIIDFGVSKFTVDDAASVDALDNPDTVVGTPHYMAPEQIRHCADVDARADLYSVGIILYKAVTGKVPYNAKTIHELIVQLVQGEPADATKWVPDLDPGFLAILRKATERETTARYQSADEFLAALEQWSLTMQANVLPHFTEDGMISSVKSALRVGGTPSELSISALSSASRRLSALGGDKGRAGAVSSHIGSVDHATRVEALLDGSGAQQFAGTAAAASGQGGAREIGDSLAFGQGSESQSHASLVHADKTRKFSAAKVAALVVTVAVVVGVIVVVAFPRRGGDERALSNAQSPVIDDMAATAATVVDDPPAAPARTEESTDESTALPPGAASSEKTTDADGVVQAEDKKVPTKARPARRPRAPRPPGAPGAGKDQAGKPASSASPTTAPPTSEWGY